MKRKSCIPPQLGSRATALPWDLSGEPAGLELLVVSEIVVGSQDVTGERD
jgi:hypothetical protein